MAKSQKERAASKERRDALAREVAKMAKTANQRLRELEKQDLGKASNAYRYMQRLHYDKDNATSTDSSCRMKFSTNFRGKTYQEIQHEAAELSRFLEAKTSTKRGVDAKYLKGFQTFQQNTSGTEKMKYSEFAEMMKNETMKNLKKVYGSDVIVRMSKRLNDGEEWKDIEAKLDGVELEKTPWLDIEEALEFPKEWRDSDPITEDEQIT